MGEAVTGGSWELRSQVGWASLVITASTSRVSWHLLVHRVSTGQSTLDPSPFRPAGGLGWPGDGPTIAAFWPAPKQARTSQTLCPPLPLQKQPWMPPPMGRPVIGHVTRVRPADTHSKGLSTKVWAPHPTSPLH